MAAEQLVRHRWPENLRGLVRLLHELAQYSGQGPIGPTQLPAWLGLGEAMPASASASADVPAVHDDVLRPRPSREDLLAVLVRHGWNINAAARHYQRDRKQTNRWIATYAIAEPDP